MVGRERVQDVGPSWHWAGMPVWQGQLLARNGPPSPHRLALQAKLACAVPASGHGSAAEFAFVQWPWDSLGMTGG